MQLSGRIVDRHDLTMLERDQIPFLGVLDGYRIMLLEFPHSHIPPGADRLVEKLLAMNVRPVIAHPERNKQRGRHLFADRSAGFSSSRGTPPADVHHRLGG